MIAYKINLMLKWSANCDINNSTDPVTFATTYTKLYVPALNLLNENSSTLLQQFNSRFRKTIS